MNIPFPIITDKSYDEFRIHIDKAMSMHNKTLDDLFDIMLESLYDGKYVKSITNEFFYSATFIIQRSSPENYGIISSKIYAIESFFKSRNKRKFTTLSKEDQTYFRMKFL